MATLLRKAWLLQAAKQDTLPKDAYLAQITEYFKHPTPDNPIAILSLSDKWHFIEAIFTEECIAELSKQISSLGSLRGGLISLKKGSFVQSLRNKNEGALLVTHATRVGSDGSYAFGNPVWVGSDSEIQAKWASVNNDEDLSQGPIAHDSSCSALLTIADIASQEMKEAQQFSLSNGDKIQWEDCIISNSQQNALDEIWPDPQINQDSQQIQQLTQVQLSHNIHNVQGADAEDGNKDVDESVSSMDDFYEDITDIDLDIDTDNEPGSQYFSPTQTPSSQALVLRTQTQSQLVDYFPSQIPNLSQTAFVTQTLLPTQAPSTQPPFSHSPRSQDDEGSPFVPSNSDNDPSQSAVSYEDEHKFSQPSALQAPFVFSTPQVNNKRENEKKATISPLVWIPPSMRVNFKKQKV